MQQLFPLNLVAARMRKSFRVILITLACAVILTCVLAEVAHAQQYVLRITQVDTSNFPRVRVYLSIADKEGQPIPDNLAVTLKLREDEQLVATNVLSQGDDVYSVLVLDVSHSMEEDDKLVKARTAAVNYVNMAPASFKIAVVRFASSADISVVADFTTDKNYLRKSIMGLVPMGATALQDGMARGLNLLKGKHGRKIVTVLTDGWENASKDYKKEEGSGRLIARAIKEECTISTIGLGYNVNTSYLQSYEKTGGLYLFSPNATQLNEVFGKAINLLAKERVIEYISNNKDLDGTRSRLSAELVVNNGSYRDDQTTIVRPGLIPHVHGNHFPFIVVALLLVVAPGVFTLGRSLLVVHRFRSNHVKRLETGSVYLNRRDLNYDTGQDGFQIGDLIVVCPYSNTPYYVRSWRMLKCRCMREDPSFCSGKFCYHYNFPPWIRHALDKFFGGREGEEGRRWLCHCAGDKSGY